MKDYIKKMLEAAGYSAADIKTILDNWDKADFTTDTAPMIETMRAHQLETYSQDKELIKKIDTEVTTRQNEYVKRTIKRVFGVSMEEMKDKDMDAIMDLSKSKVTTGQNQNLETLQAEKLKLEQEVERLKENEKTIRSEVDKDKRQLKIERAIEKMATKHSENLRVPFETALDTCKLHLAAGYQVDLDENDNLVLKDKAGLKVKNEAGNGWMTPEDAWVATLKKNQFIKESNGNDGGGGNGGAGGGGNGGAGNGGAGTQKHNEGKADLYERFPHLAAAEQKVKDDKTHFEQQKKKL